MEFLIVVAVLIALGLYLRRVLIRRNEPRSETPPRPAAMRAAVAVNSEASAVSAPHSLDAKWLGPLTDAGFTPSLAPFVRVLEHGTLVADRSRIFSDGMPFLRAAPAVLIVEDGRVAIAAQDGKKIRVITRDADDGRLMVSRFGALQIVFGTDASVDGWTFDGLRTDTPEGREVGDTLSQWIVSG